MQPVLLSLFRLLATTLAGACVQSPVSWSPDGQWLAYTLVETAEPPAHRDGWLFEPRAEPISPYEIPVQRAEGSAAARRYRIWATEKGSGSSVLIADSAEPLSAPVWGPEGHSLFYARFVPRFARSREGLVRGEVELVLQQTLEEHRVIGTLPETVLHRDQVAAFSELRASWSPDGRYLAIPRPGGSAALLIVLPEQGRVLKTLEGASLPSWSPDSTRLAFVRTFRAAVATQSLQIVGHDFSAARSLAELTAMTEPAAWSQDGQSILVAARRLHGRNSGFEILRILVDSGATIRAMSLSDDAGPRNTPRGPLQARNPRQPGNPAGWGMIDLEPPTTATAGPKRFSVDFDRDQEFCAFASDLDGPTPVIGYGNIRRQAVIKKFHPLVAGLPLGTLALHPDGQTLAIRVETAGGMSPPLLCDLGSTHVKLLAPDSTARQEWLTTLAGAAQSLLQTVPQPLLDGQPVDRVSLLPASGEILPQSPVTFSLRRLGKVARALLDEPPAAHSSALKENPADPSEDEYRLFFDYLRGDYATAETDLDMLSARAGSTELRFRLLALKAQVLQGLHQERQARAVIEYLRLVQGAPPRTVEETPVGRVLTPVADHRSSWTRYLAEHCSDTPAAGSDATGGNPAENDEAIDLHVPEVMDALDGRLLDQNPRFPGRMQRPGQFEPMRPQLPGGGRMGGPPGVFGPGVMRPQRDPRFVPPQPPQPAGADFPQTRRFRRSGRFGQPQP